jgi:two-component sensor histidine kinase/PAS domain-containing protein
MSSEAASSSRIAALEAYQILDTPPEPAFDDIASLASAFCETPIALVSLVDRDRQWFKAKVGMEACETPLELSVCAHALAQHDLLVIPDLTLDPRTQANTLVTGPPHIRFYAGAPLVTPGGQVIGTLCVIDLHPRPAGLRPAQARALEQLARQVMTLLEMRARLLEHAAGAQRIGALSLAHARSDEAEKAALRDSEVRARIAQEAGRIGTFELDIASGQIQVSAEFCRVFGLPLAPSYHASELEALILPEDRRVGFSQVSGREGSAATDADYRIRRADDGSLRWINRRSDFLRDAAGNPVSMSGTVQDITEQRLTAQRVAAMTELGDALRDATTEAEVPAKAAAILGRTLGASRVGYAGLEPRGTSFMIGPDWVSAETGSIAGPHALATFSATLAQMRQGRIQVIADVEAEADVAADLAAYRSIGARAAINAPQLLHGELTDVLFVHAAGPRHWTDEEVRFVQGVSDRIHATLGRLRAEAAQKLLNHELSHRLKNTLAMVQAIASQTLRQVQPRESVVALERRIHALSAAHDVLLQHNWAAAPIQQSVQKVMQALGQESRVSASGPEISLGQRSALSLAMLLHELTTNALKYGALSVEAGQVTLRWHVEGEGEEANLVLCWREAGGPPVQPPGQAGFGSTLIRMGLGGTGEVALRYPSSGLEADIRALLMEVREY